MDMQTERGPGAYRAQVEGPEGFYETGTTL